MKIMQCLLIYSCNFPIPGYGHPEHAAGKILLLFLIFFPKIKFFEIEGIYFVFVQCF